MAWPTRLQRDRLPRALSGALVLAVHGAAMALAWQAMAPPRPAPGGEAAPGLLYLLPAAGMPAAPPPVARAAAATARPPEPRPAPAAARAPGPAEPPAPRAAAAGLAGAISLPVTASGASPQALASPPAPLAVAPSAPAPRGAAAASEPAAGLAALAPRALGGNALPAYPEAAREDGLQGRVQLLLQIDADGRVVGVQWLQRSGVALLDLAARDTLRGWRYEPARRGSEAVAGSVTVTIRFQLDAPVSATTLAQRAP